MEQNCCGIKPYFLLIPFLVLSFLFLLIVLFFKFIGPIPVSVNSVSTTKTDLFTVSGEGRVSEAPNMAIVNLGFTASNLSAKEVQNQGNNIINTLTSELQKLGIDEKDIKTINYNLNPDYDFTAGGNRIKGYQININLEVKVRDFEKINGVLDAATKNGANIIGGLQFSFDDEKLLELENQARAEAVKKAKEKARSLAEISGVRLGRIINIQEGSGNIPVRQFAQPALMTEEVKTNVQKGEQEIRVNITLTYETL